MIDLWDNIVPLAVIALAAFLTWGLGHLILVEIKQDQTRYEQCIAADKQWVKGSCVK